MQTPPAAAPQASRAARELKSRAPGSHADRSPVADSPVIQVQGLGKTYQTARGALHLFQDLNLEVEAGEMVAIVGQSGAGKSTLLHILGALDTPSAGTVYCASTNVAALSTREAAAFRNREIGYVWQFHYLLPEFTALENVAMPLLARGMGKSEALASGGKVAERGGFGGSRRASARRAFRRRAAARGAGPGAGLPAAAAAGRRTDRRPGRHYGRPGL